MTSRPLLLGAYAAKQCARRVHNDWDATIPRIPWDAPPELQARWDAGNAFEALVMDRLLASLGDRAVDLRGEDSPEARIAATVAAMTAATPVILGGRLPDDQVGGRSGLPDLLVLTSGIGEPPGYVPGDVKAHRTVRPSAARTMEYSLPDDPATVRAARGHVARIADRLGDFMQLAHYSRMLDACGFGPSGPDRRGFIIGTDALVDLDPGGIVLTWHDLAAPVFSTFSRTEGTKARSALERYDHEHGFRLLVAARARERSGRLDDPEPLVVPVFQAECDTCPWRATCAELIGADSASMAITHGRLDVREWLALAALGVETTEELAQVDLSDDLWMSEYLAEVAHQVEATKRLSKAVERARMICSGETLRRTTRGPISVPRADVEIDFDIEWDTANRVYLWGALLRRPGHGDEYHPFVAWAPLDGAAEAALAADFLAWLRAQITEAKGHGQDVAVFHYSDPEPAHLASILGQDEVSDVLAHFVDLLPIVRANFFGVEGLGIKKVAPAFGFHWRDEDPGGLQSQAWLEEARRDAAHSARLQARILDYNEDDVRATAALRDGLRRLA